MSDQQKVAPCVANGRIPYAVRVPLVQARIEVIMNLGGIYVKPVGDGLADLYHKRR